MYKLLQWPRRMTLSRVFRVTNVELANQLLVSSKTISNWETGKTTPDIDNLIRIASLFQISLDNLLTEGSEVVENIKKKAEINNLKNIHTVQSLQI